MSGKLSVANLIAGIGGLVTLLFSFFAFIKQGDESRNAWSDQAGAFVVTIPAILGLAMVVVVALSLADVKLPDNVITFNWDQIKATWGISAAGILVAHLGVELGGADRGFGYWLMLLGSIAMAVGPVMALLGKGTEMVNFGGTGGQTAGQQPGGGTAPPPPGGAAPPPPSGGGAPPPPPPGP